MVASDVVPPERPLPAVRSSRVSNTVVLVLVNSQSPFSVYPSLHGSGSAITDHSSQGEVGFGPGGKVSVVSSQQHASREACVSPKLLRSCMTYARWICRRLKGAMFKSSPTSRPAHTWCNAPAPEIGDGEERP